MDCLCADFTTFQTITGVVLCDFIICCGISTNDYFVQDDLPEYDINTLSDHHISPQTSPRKSHNHHDKTKQTACNTQKSFKTQDEYTYNDLSSATMSPRNVMSPRENEIISTNEKLDFSKFDIERELYMSFHPFEIKSGINTKRINENSNTMITSSSSNNILPSSSLSLNTTNKQEEDEKKPNTIYIASLKIARNLPIDEKNPNIPFSVVTKCLSKYQYVITVEQDFETKKALILEYEKAKHLYDIDNNEDLLHAQLHLKAARNEHTTTYSYKDQISFYQKAIFLTNDLVRKNEIIEEYKAFCVYLVLKTKK
jgi:hypothetical protein